ncbi:MAG: nitrophenyl compound nitroreductase subunit ArsF family protein [Verrucomicrobiales bacterium]|nr:nitrophenyl compound nitroreductase subunit ArsF family protein [Verrucomicrobiales bacterium]
MERYKKILTQCLLSFALISIGFAMGKHSVKPTARTGNLPGGNGDQVAVYYLHSSFRCVTCNSIEKMARELVNQSYSNQLASGEIVWIEDDFQENEALAKQFELASSSVVVARINNGEVTDFKRLDDVWILVDEPDSFNQYISDAIDGYLKTSEDKS